MKKVVCPPKRAHHLGVGDSARSLRRCTGEPPRPSQESHGPSAPLVYPMWPAPSAGEYGKPHKPGDRGPGAGAGSCGGLSPGCHASRAFEPERYGESSPRRTAELREGVAQLQHTTGRARPLTVVAEWPRLASFPSPEHSKTQGGGLSRESTWTDPLPVLGRAQATGRPQGKTPP